MFFSTFTYHKQKSRRECELVYDKIEQRIRLLASWGNSEFPQSHKGARLLQGHLPGPNTPTFLLFSLFILNCFFLLWKNFFFYFVKIYFTLKNLFYFEKCILLFEKWRFSSKIRFFGVKIVFFGENCFFRWK